MWNGAQVTSGTNLRRAGDNDGSRQQRGVLAAVAHDLLACEDHVAGRVVLYRLENHARTRLALHTRAREVHISRRPNSSRAEQRHGAYQCRSFGIVHRHAAEWEWNAPGRSGAS